MTETKSNMDPVYILSLSLKLFVTCVVVSGLLGAVNMVTLPNITRIKAEQKNAAMQAVVTDENSTFEDVEVSEEAASAASAAGAKLTGASAVLLNGENAGYALTVVASGSQGTIEMMVGVDAEGTVTGVSIVDNSETPGIGSKVMGNEPTASGVGVLDQFQGKSAADGTLAVGSNIDGITGATVSSRGVTAGVNAALAAAAVMA